MTDQNATDINSSVKSLMYGLLVLFLLVFLSGFVPGVKNLFLIPLVIFSALGVALLVKTKSSSTEGRQKTLLQVTGYLSLLFSIGVGYGVLGILGFYEIYDPLYLTLVIASGMGFLCGAIGTLYLRRKTQRASGIK